MINQLMLISGICALLGTSAAQTPINTINPAIIDNGNNDYKVNAIIPFSLVNLDDENVEGSYLSIDFFYTQNTLDADFEIYWDMGSGASLMTETRTYSLPPLETLNYLELTMEYYVEDGDQEQSVLGNIYIRSNNTLLYDVYYEFQIQPFHRYDDTFDIPFYYINLNTLKTCIEVLQKLNSAYQEGYTEGHIAGYQTGKQAGDNEGYQRGYDAGIAYSISQGSTATEIFSGIINVALLPINFFLACFNFEVFGINIGGFVSATITVLIIIIVYRVIISGGTGGKND